MSSRRLLSSLLLVASVLAILPRPSVAQTAAAPSPGAAAPGVQPAAGEKATDGVGPAAPAAVPLSQDQFAALVARELSAHFSLEGDLQLELMRNWEAPDRVAQRWQVTIIEFPSVPSAAMLVRCRLLADGTPVADLPLVLRAALWRDAWVSRQPLGNNATFDPSLLEVRRVDFFHERDAVPASVGDRSFLFVRPVSAGRLLTWRDIGRRPLVRKGELVEVSAADGQLIITMKGLAMQNGAQGEAVMIRNLESKKDFTAFVIDENRVQVRF
ncbi:MAG: flagellar basal body P-ring formation chaperone FlgA [Opitutales bacterium]